jgi:Tol biopolymer transport system component
LIEKPVAGNRNGRPGFSVSASGVLVYGSEGQGLANQNRQLVFEDRNGKIATVGNPTNSVVSRLSPDGKRVAFSESAGAGRRNLWIYDIGRNVRMRLTTAAMADMPVWSPDGTQLVFQETQGTEESAIYQVPANAAVPEQVLLPPEAGFVLAPLDWSPDGRFLIFRKDKLGSIAGDLWVLPLFGDRKAYPYLVSPFTKGRAVLSPNGRWLAYVSNESGTQEVFVQPFPNAASGKWQISTEGGTFPKWRRDGHELYYLDFNRRVIAVSVSTERDFAVKGSTTLFDTNLFLSTITVNYSPFDVAGEGEHFLLLSTSETVPQFPGLKVVLNWDSALKSQ